MQPAAVMHKACQLMGVCHELTSQSQTIELREDFIERQCLLPLKKQKLTEVLYRGCKVALP